MSQTTVGFAGMSGAEETELRALFEQANAEGGGRFAEADQASADVLVIDTDSIHGHMTWLQTRNDDHRRIIALSARETPHSDFCIVKPADLDAMARALAAMASSQPAGIVRATAVEADEGNETRAEGEVEAVTAERPDDPAHNPRDQPALGAHDPGPDALDGDLHPAETNTGEPDDPVDPPDAPARLADYLVAGALPGPARLKFEGAPELVVDPATQTYLGPTQLKGFQAYAGAERIDPADWKSVEATELARLADSNGQPQPWARLLWLAGLYGSPGRLTGTHDAEERFELLRWPQIEREFPRHFRIATTMMKGPATAGEIAEAAGSPLEEVIDFINASLAAGQARRVQAQLEPESDPEPRGLLGRLKGLRGS